MITKAENVIPFDTPKVTFENSTYLDLRVFLFSNRLEMFVCQTPDTTTITS